MTSANDRTVEKIENMCGGKGHVLIERLLGEKELDGKCGLYAKVTIDTMSTMARPRLTTYSPVRACTMTTARSTRSRRAT